MLKGEGKLLYYHPHPPHRGFAPTDAVVLTKIQRAFTDKSENFPRFCFRHFSGVENTIGDYTSYQRHHVFAQIRETRQKSVLK